MSGETRERLEEGPRVRVRARVVQRTGAVPLNTVPLRSALREAELRFLSVQRSAAAEMSAGALSEYLAILGDLRRIDEDLQQASGRRDLPYFADRRLGFLNEYCHWLARRVSAEFLLILRVHLEQELRRIVGPDAYQRFLRLEEIGDAARNMERLSDRELIARLREGTLLREILEQVRLGDMLGQIRGVTAPAGSFEEGSTGTPLR